MRDQPATRDTLRGPIGDRRRFTRIPFDAVVRVRGRGRIWTAVLVDISLRGALIVRPPDWPTSGADEHRLSVELDAGEGAIIAMEASPVHVAGGHVGFRCERIDVDSATHLRRLVELNLGDPALLERELEALVPGLP